MLGYILAAMLLAAIGFILFSPLFKGLRTLIYGWLTVIIGAVIPLGGEIIGYLQELDWRQYVLASDRKNLIVLGIVGGLGVMAIILRHMTSGPVGEK